MTLKRSLANLSHSGILPLFSLLSLSFSILLSLPFYLFLLLSFCLSLPRIKTISALSKPRGRESGAGGDPLASALCLLLELPFLELLRAPRSLRSPTGPFLSFGQLDPVLAFPKSVCHSPVPEGERRKLGPRVVAAPFSSSLLGVLQWRRSEGARGRRGPQLFGNEGQCFKRLAWQHGVGFAPESCCLEELLVSGGVAWR